MYLIYIFFQPSSKKKVYLKKMASTLSLIFIMSWVTAPLVTGHDHHHSGMKLEPQPGDSPRNMMQDPEFRRDRE